MITTHTQPKGIDLRIDGLHKTFGHLPVLQNLTLEARPGEFIAIVGRSGCGKSTLLRLITGLELPTQGIIYLDGTPVKRLPPDVRVMFQDPRLLPWQKVDRNVSLGLERSARPKAHLALQQVGLASRAKEYPAVLSGGQRQRVALARALASSPRLLLLDEPLGALDAFTRLEMQQLIEGLWHELQFTVLLITHDVEEAVALADRVVLLEDGQIATDVSINLPRPRSRGSGVFAELVENLRSRVMHHPQSPQSVTRELGYRVA